MLEIETKNKFFKKIIVLSVFSLIIIFFFNLKIFAEKNKYSDDISFTTGFALVNYSFINSDNFRRSFVYLRSTNRAEQYSIDEIGSVSGLSIYFDINSFLDIDLFDNYSIGYEFQSLGFLTTNSSTGFVNNSTTNNLDYNYGEFERNFNVTNHLIRINYNLLLDYDSETLNIFTPPKVFKEYWLFKFGLKLGLSEIKGDISFSDDNSSYNSSVKSNGNIMLADMGISYHSSKFFNTFVNLNLSFVLVNDYENINIDYVDIDGKGLSGKPDLSGFQLSLGMGLFF